MSRLFRSGRSALSLRLAALAAALAAAWAPWSPAAAQATDSPFTWATRYDAAGRATGTIAPDPDGTGPLKFAASRITYDAAGRQIRAESGQLENWESEAIPPSSWTEFTLLQRVESIYDPRGLKLKETSSGVPSGGGPLTVQSVVEHSYDSDGRILCTAIRMNPAEFALQRDACTPGTPSPTYGPDRIVSNSYDAAGQLLQTREGVGTADLAVESTRDYTRNGKLKTLIDANGNRAEMRYDQFDRLQCWILPSTARPAAYNPATQATALASAGAPGGDCSNGDFEFYGYDSASNRTSFRKRDGSTLTYQYDALNRLSAKIVPERDGLTLAQTRDVHYEYDNRGLMTAASFGAPGNDFLRTWYDGFGQPATVLTYMSGQPRYLNHIYDRDGNREHLIHTNDNARFRYYYDGLGRMTAVHDKPNYSSPDDLVVRYFYRPQGQRQVAVFGSGSAGISTGYYYDGLQRLAAIGNDLAAAGADWSINLQYNPASQIVRRELSHDSYAWSGAVNDSLSYTANGLNQYAQVGINPYTYDPNGNLADDGIATYTYDVENRLVAASGGVGLVYDPLGRLAEVSSPNTGVTRFQYDGNDLIAEYDSAGTLLKRYVHGPGADEPVAVYDGPALGLANRRYLLADERGSIAALVGTGGGAPATNTYDSWGRPGGNNQGRFQYTGQAWIPQLGLYHYKARLYSPMLGRFLQTDPVGYEDQVNLYAYVGNDPVNGTDPTGQFRCYKTSYGQHCVSDGTVFDNIAVLTYKFMVEAGMISMIESSEEPDRTSDDPLRTNEHGQKVPDPEAAGSSHTQLGTRTGRNGKYPQSREFDEDDNPVRDVDHTDHGRPGEHTNPHQHRWLPNPTGGSPKRGPSEPMPKPPELPRSTPPPPAPFPSPPTVRKLPF